MNVNEYQAKEPRAKFGAEIPARPAALTVAIDIGRLLSPSESGTTLSGLFRG